MDDNLLRMQAIQRALASWYDNVVQTHTQSLQMRQTMYASFLTQQAAVQQSFMEMLAHGAHSTMGQAGPCRIDVTTALVESLVQYWQRAYNIGHGLIRDLFFALCTRFLNTMVFADEATLEYLRHRQNGVMFLANHQTAIESSLFSIVFSALHRRPIVALSKAEHRTSWIGAMLQLVSEYPGADVPTAILYMDRANQATVLHAFHSMMNMVKLQQYSALVHVEGTRALQAGKPVTSISATLIDMACAEGIPLVPVRFSGGLAAGATEFRLNYPLGFGTQDILVGKPIEPEVLRQMSSSVRRQYILQQLNGLTLKPERPNPPNLAFEGQIDKWRKWTAIAEEKLALIAALAHLDSPSQETVALLSAIQGHESLNGQTAQAAWLRKTAEFFWATPTRNFNEREQR